MKIVVAVLIAFLLGALGRAQSGSVWVEDYGADAMKAAVAAGKTTLIYYGGSSLAVANHREVARYVAERVAEELTNALVLPIIPNDAEAYGAVNRAITVGGFKNVMIMGDDGPPSGDMTLENVAKKLDLDNQSHLNPGPDSAAFPQPRPVIRGSPVRTCYLVLAPAASSL
jgi:hypothetical protein